MKPARQNEARPNEIRTSSNKCITRYLRPKLYEEAGEGEVNSTIVLANVNTLLLACLVSLLMGFCGCSTS